VETKCRYSICIFQGRAEMEDYHIDIRLLQFLFSVKFCIQLDVPITKMHKMNLSLFVLGLLLKIISIHV